MTSEDEYESLVEEARKRTRMASKDYIPKCCEILKKQGVPQEKITHRIRKDFAFWGHTTIYEAIPEEYKKETKPKKIPPPESILLEQSTSGTSHQSSEPNITDASPRLHAAVPELAKLTERDMEELTGIEAQPEPLKRKHEEAYMPLPLANQLNKFLLARLIGIANGNSDKSIKFKINDQGELYLPA